MKKLPILALSSLAISLCASTTAFAELINCKPVKNCRAGDKPCFVEVTQRDWMIDFVGADGAENPPMRRRAAIRIRACTGVDDVCKSGTRDQRFNWNVIDQQTGQIVVSGQLGSVTGIWDTGPYTEIGPHTYFGGVCLNGPRSCRIAWQYCQFELPLVAGGGAGASQPKKASDIAPHMTNRQSDHVRTHRLLFGR
ncbi:MAG: hypothetical protein K2Z80_07010 [Xanthobacteraceae bacterium]|nr:hypothetical protein [Xanthobacteraceae bacterium]